MKYMPICSKKAKKENETVSTVGEVRRRYSEAKETWKEGLVSACDVWFRIRVCI